jgi:hypothetical protein
MTSGQGGVVLQMMVGEVGRQSAWTGSRRMGGGRGVAKLAQLAKRWKMKVGESLDDDHDDMSRTMY